MKTNSKFKDFKVEIQKFISESNLLKRNQSVVVQQRDIKGTNKKKLSRGSGLRGKEDALWFNDESFLKFEILIQITGKYIDIIKYSIRWEAADVKNVFLIRYEWDGVIPEKENHPRGHLHINKYNNLRLPTEKLEFQSIFNCIEDWIEKRREIQKNN